MQRFGRMPEGKIVKAVSNYRPDGKRVLCRTRLRWKESGRDIVLNPQRYYDR